MAKKEDGARPVSVAKKEDEVQSAAPRIYSPVSSVIPTASVFWRNSGRSGQPRNYVVDVAQVWCKTRLAKISARSSTFM